MSEALRSLLAEFVVTVDRAGELAKGSAAVDALKLKLTELQTSFAGVKAPAQQTAQTLRGKLGGAIDAVRAGFNGGGGSGGQGLIASLATVRNGFLALGAGATVHAVKSLVDGIGSIGERASALGVTTDQFQRLDTLAKINNTSVEALGTAFRTLATSAVEPTKEAAEAFARLGVSVRGADGQFRSTNDLFFDVGEALAGVANETERSQLAQKLLGRSAQQLKPIFASGTEAFRQQRLELLKLKVLSPELIKSADDMSDSWIVLGTQLLATAGPVLEKVLFPALKRLTVFLVDGVEWLGKVADKTDFMALAITALGYAVGTKLLPGLARMLVLAPGVEASLFAMAGAAAKAAVEFAILAAKFFIIQDVISFLIGNESTIGSVMDKLFGKGASTGVLETLSKAWDMLASAVKRTMEALGIRKQDEEDKAQEGRAGSAWEGSNFQRLAQGIQKYSGQPGAFTADTGGLLGQSIPMPGYSPSGGGPGMSAPPNITVGDNNVTITMSQSATASDVAGAVGQTLGRDREALQSSYPQ
jgi:hypothetical protein